MEFSSRRISFLSLLFICTLLSLAVVQGCFNYVCSDTYKTCTKKSGDNVFINSKACPSKYTISITLTDINYAKSKNKFNMFVGDEECYISEDDSESHCMKKIVNTFPTFLFPGYKCTFGDSTS